MTSTQRHHITSEPSSGTQSPDTTLSNSKNETDNIIMSQGGIDEYAGTFSPGWRFLVAFGSVCVVVLMVALDACSISVTIPKITTDLHGTAIEGFWSGTAFLLTDTVLQPVYGSFSDIFGRKRMLLVALFVFFLGAIIAAVAQNMTTLLAGRVVQGSGGAGVYVLSEMLITDLVPLRFRGNYYSIMTAMWAIGSVSGPLIGGAFSEDATWRWIFWINLPFLAVGVPMIIVFLKLHFTSTSLAEKLRRVDWIGTILFLTTTTDFLIPVTWGGVNYPWSSFHTLVPLILCAFGLVAFVVWEARFATEPLIHMRIFRTRNAAVTYFGDTIHGAIIWCALYYMPLYFQAVKDASPIESGVDMLPTTLTVAPCAVIVGAIITRVGSYRWAIWAGWTIATIGYGLSYLLDVKIHTGSWILIRMTTGVGTGMLFPSLTFAIMAATPSRDQAYSVALITFFRAAGQTIGVAIGGTIFQNRIKHEIMKYPSIAPHAQSYSKDATQLVEIIKAMPGSVAKADLIRSYADALKIVWVVMCCLSVTALIVSLWTQHFSLDQKLETDQGFKYKEKETREVESSS